MSALRNFHRKLMLFIGISGLVVVSWYGNQTPVQASKNGSSSKLIVGTSNVGFWLRKWFADDNAPKKRSPRVFCWVLTQPKNHQKAVGVKETWLKRCDGYVFISSEDNDTLPAMDAHLGEGRDVLWGKTKFGFRYAYDFIDQHDWFLKADDDTYVIVENLKLLLKDYSPQQPLYFGHHFKTVAPEGYMSGGAGYVLSQAALRKFVEVGLSKKICREENNFPEDLMMGYCMHSLNVTFGDSRDATGHNRFFPFSPAKHTDPEHMKKEWGYLNYTKYPEREKDAAAGGKLTDCCSDSAISFHYVNNMYWMEYMLYHLRPHGVWSKS